MGWVKLFRKIFAYFPKQLWCLKKGANCGVAAISKWISLLFVVLSKFYIDYMDTLFTEIVSICFVWILFNQLSNTERYTAKLTKVIFCSGRMICMLDITGITWIADKFEYKQWKDMPTKLYWIFFFSYACSYENFW